MAVLTRPGQLFSVVSRDNGLNGKCSADSSGGLEGDCPSEGSNYPPPVLHVFTLGISSFISSILPVLLLIEEVWLLIIAAVGRLVRCFASRSRVQLPLLPGVFRPRPPAAYLPHSEPLL